MIPQFDAGTPAEKTLALLEQIMHGEQVSLISASLSAMDRTPAGHNWYLTFLSPYPLLPQTNMRDVIELRDAVISSGSGMYQPMNLVKRMQGFDRNEDVNRALLMMLSEHASVKLSRA